MELVTPLGCLLSTKTQSPDLGLGRTVSWVDWQGPLELFAFCRLVYSLLASSEWGHGQFLGQVQ